MYIYVCMLKCAGGQKKMVPISSWKQGIPPSLPPSFPPSLPPSPLRTRVHHQDEVFALVLSQGKLLEATIGHDGIGCRRGIYMYICKFKYMCMYIHERTNISIHVYMNEGMNA